jgi:transketolase
MRSLDPVLRRRLADTLRMLAADAVQKADSGHPGAPMGQADLAMVLWHEFLRFDPDDPTWPARDRFVLSCGHASMLLYGLLHLWGFNVSLEDLKQFRQWDSITPGHPEVGHTPGVEVTTGPLGQGVANSVGMALAAKMLQARIDAPGAPFQVMGQRVFVLCSDGDLMEGISSEAASLAGHWQLDNLVWLYDDNGITIDGATSLAFTEDVGQRFEAFGWRVLTADGHDADQVRTALNTATTEGGKPTLIRCKTHIGYGSPSKVDSAKAHGEPLGEGELSKVRGVFGWPEERFHIPAEVAEFLEEARDEKRDQRAAWQVQFNAWRLENPEQAALYDQLWSGEVPADLWETLVAAAPAAGATRKSSGKVLAAALKAMPSLVGGSADLTGSNGLETGSDIVGHPDRGFSFAGRQLHYGIREHAMGAITNGILLHGGLRPFGGTFLVFSDYERPAIRLAALSHLPNIFVFTHDSVFLGEDGPTHQPIEHHWALRTIPELLYFRPGDGIEVAMCWAYALQVADGPVALALTRQNVPAMPRPADFDPQVIWCGGYAVQDCEDPEVVLVGTGSEVQLCVAAGQALTAEGRRVRVVSMPCYELFLTQPEEFQEALIPTSARVVTIEAGITGPWRALSGRNGLNIGIDRFGASAPAEVIAEKLGLTAAQVTDRIRTFLGEKHV